MAKTKYEGYKKRRPATTVEARENQLISYAVDLAEAQMIEGTASSQVITHYLKLGTVREELEREKLRQENKLLEAKVESLASSKRIEALYGEALAAMKRYSGTEEPEDEYEDEDEDF